VHMQWWQTGVCCWGSWRSSNASDMKFTLMTLGSPGRHRRSQNGPSVVGVTYRRQQSRVSGPRALTYMQDDNSKSFIVAGLRTDMPAFSMLVRVSTLFDTGPMVQTSLVEGGPLVWSSCNY